VQTSRSSLYFLLVALIAGFILSLVFYAFEQKPEDIAASIKIVDFQSKWIPSTPPLKSMVKPWEVFIAPTISFRVKNVGKKPINFIAFNAVFLRKRSEMKLGTSYKIAIRKPLKPGGVSEVITMTSDGGYAGSSIKALMDNPFWEPVICRLYFAKSEKYILLGTFDIEDRIETGSN